jgi:hypothetical protein
MGAVLARLVLCLLPAAAGAGTIEWRRYAISSTGASVDIPATIFSEDAEAPEGDIGRRAWPRHRDHGARLRISLSAPG